MTMSRNHLRHNNRLRRTTTNNNGSSSSSSSKRLRPRRICLFGTSANPPTGENGHVGIVRALVNLRKFDEVRVLPVYKHTFASKRNQLLGFDHRVAMCELAVEGLSSRGRKQQQQQQPKADHETDPETDSESDSHNDDDNDNDDDGFVATEVVVSRAEEDSFQRMVESSRAETDEEKSSLRVGTAELLEMFMEDEEHRWESNSDVATASTSPKTEFFFCLGADTFLDLTDWKWKRSRDVLKLLEGRLVVLRRIQELGLPRTKPNPNDVLKERIEEINATPLGNGNIVLLDIPSLGNVSSSKVRNAVNKDLVKGMVQPKVLDYLANHKLYGFGESGGEHTEEVTPDSRQRERELAVRN